MVSFEKLTAARLWWATLSAKGRWRNISGTSEFLGPACSWFAVSRTPSPSVPENPRRKDLADGLWAHGWHICDPPPPSPRVLRLLKMPEEYIGQKTGLSTYKYPMQDGATLLSRNIRKAMREAKTSPEDWKYGFPGV